MRASTCDMLTSVVLLPLPLLLPSRHSRCRGRAAATAADVPAIFSNNSVSEKLAPLKVVSALQTD